MDENRLPERARILAEPAASIEALDQNPSLVRTREELEAENWQLRKRLQAAEARLAAMGRGDGENQASAMRVKGFEGKQPHPPLQPGSIFSPEGDSGDLELLDILDVPTVQSLMDHFYELVRIPMAIIDLAGRVLVGVGWQEICTKYHRVHPETRSHCLESDTELSAGLLPEQYKLYKCKNHMWDVATPITVGGRHMGNLFTGQFFFDGEPLDYELFRAQARQYGFDEEAYIAALEAVPRLSREMVDASLAFFTQLAHMLSQLSYSNIKLARSLVERGALMESLRNSQEDLQRAQAVGQIGSWRLDVRRNELVWSDEIHRMFGIPKTDPLSYETFLATVHPEDREYVDRNWQAALRGAVYDVEHRIVIGDSVKWIHEKAELEFDSQGTLLGGFGTTQDVTHRKAIEDQLRAANLSAEQAKAAADAANVAKSQFLANMSHELRTPMNAILGMTDLALAEPISPTVRDFLQTSKESADLLLELLNQLLDFSRIEARRFELESAPFSLQRTVEQVAKTLGVRAYEKGLELVCDLPGEVPDLLVGDSLRLRQILVNLIGNAVKFTAKGEIVLRAAVEQRDSDEATLVFSVADTGMGIAPEDQERIFSPFTQADAATARHYGGSGLGLAITSSLVKLMGGRIWVESRPGEGSTFYFTARFGIQQQEGTDQAGLVDRKVLGDMAVLVVAENATHRQILERTLLSWSMRPETASDVPTALTKIHEAASLDDPFRLVLTDAVLSGIDGFTLVDWLRNQPELAGPVILMLSAAERHSHVDRCRAAEAICVDKPISRSDLFNAIAKVLGHAGLGAVDLHAGESAQAPPVRILRVLLAEDTPANQKLVMHVLKNRGHHVEVAQNGQQALERLQQQDFDLVLMDLQMPIMDGIQATAAIRNLNDPRKASLPIIAMTAHAMKGDRERCLAAGMNSYISKPINGDEMIEVLERLAGPCDGGEQEVPAPHQEVAARMPAETGDGVPQVSLRDTGVFNLDEAVKMCFGKFSMFQEMIDCFFDEADPQLEQMKAALGNGSATELANTAHRLKGTVVYLAAHPAAEAIRRVEQIGKSGDLTGAAQAISELDREIVRLKDALRPHRQ